MCKLLALLQARRLRHDKVGLPFGITLAQNVEQEGIHIIVQSFVVQEQFAEQAQALAVHLVLLAIHLMGQNHRQTSSQYQTHMLRYVQSRSCLSKAVCPELSL